MAFKKGQSGNPGGRPREDDEIKEVKSLAKKHSLDAIKKLVEILSCGDARVEITAAQAILDRGLGKPAQEIDIGNKEGEPFKSVHEVLITALTNDSGNNTDT